MKQEVLSLVASEIERIKKEPKYKDLLVNITLPKTTAYTTILSTEVSILLESDCYSSIPDSPEGATLEAWWTHKTFRVIAKSIFLCWDTKRP